MKIVVRKQRDMSNNRTGPFDFALRASLRMTNSYWWAEDRKDRTLTTKKGGGRNGA